MDRPDADALAWTPNARIAFQRDHDRDAEFELVVRSLIDGIHARLSAPSDVSEAGGAATRRPRR